MSASTTTKILPWGEEILKELPIYKKSVNKFYARHGKTVEGRAYIEFSKFGPKPDTEGEFYRQKLRIYNPVHWLAIKNLMEGELSNSIGWDLAAAQKEYQKSLVAEAAPTKEKWSPESAGRALGVAGIYSYTQLSPHDIHRP